MDNYTFREYADMHLFPGRVSGNNAAAVSVYADKYPQCRLPDPRTFHAIDRSIRETGIVHPPSVDRGRRRSA
jgi:hypothetical protein